jgi:hypothetical protein
MKVYCHTNLDLDNEEWPSELPCLPQVGNLIQSRRERGTLEPLSLAVCRIRWIYSSTEGGYVAHIELHIPSIYANLSHFYEFYGRLTGRGKHAFI